MYLQEFKIYLIGGHMLKAAEDVTIPAEHRLLYRFKNAKLKDVLSVGSEEPSQAYIPVRNILYISTGDVIRW